MYELVHYLGETTFSFSSNAIVYSWFHQLNAAISSHNTHHWLLFRYEDNHPKKTDTMTLPVDGTVFAFSGVNSSLSIHCIDCSFVKRWIHVSSIVMNRRRSLTLLRWNIDWNILTIQFLFYCKQLRYPSWAQLSHIQIFSQYTMYNTFWNVSTSLRTLVDGHPTQCGGFSSPFLEWSPHMVDHCDVRTGRAYDLV